MLELSVVIIPDGSITLEDTIILDDSIMLVDMALVHDVVEARNHKKHTILVSVHNVHKMCMEK